MDFLWKQCSFLDQGGGNTVQGVQVTLHPSTAAPQAGRARLRKVKYKTWSSSRAFGDLSKGCLDVSLKGWRSQVKFLGLKQRWVGRDGDSGAWFGLLPHH